MNRLNIIRGGFKHIVDGVVLLTTANHFIIGSDRHPTPEKRMLFKQLMTSLAESVVNDANTDSVIDAFCVKLDSANVLTGSQERGTFIKALKSGIHEKDDNVRKLM